MNYELGEYIEKGKYGRVYQAKNDKNLAIKVIKKKKLKDYNLDDEISILKKLQCDYIVKFFDWYDDDTRVYQIFEYVSGGDLYYRIKKGLLNKNISLLYLKQMATAIDYIHKNHIMHRDIKPENILIDKNDNIKLTDFGFATKFKDGEKFNAIVGSIYFLAPEIINNYGYDYRIDIWMLGVVYYEMLTGNMPFEGNDAEEVTRKISLGKYKLPITLSFNSKFNITSILCSNPDLRVSISTILKMN